MKSIKFGWPCIACIALGSPVNAGEITTIFDGESNGGVTLDSVGDIYVANYGNVNAVTGSEFVWKLSPTGAFDPVIFASDINIASGNDFDSEDNLYQSNFGGDSISKIDPSGIETEFASVNNPVGITIDDDDNLFVNSCQDNAIIQIAPDGTTTTFLSSAQFNCPNGITLAPSGDFYVINWHDGRIHRITAEGDLSFFASVPAPGGHVTVAGERLYATSIGAHQVRGFDIASGALAATIGSGTAGSADGTYFVAQFNRPNGIAADATGEVLYVTGQNGVRRVALEDEVAPPPPPTPSPPAAQAPSGGGGGSAAWGTMITLFGLALAARRRKRAPQYP